MALANILVAYPAALIALTLVSLVAPQRTGMLALAQIAAPHLILGCLPLVTLAVITRARLLAGTLVIASFVGVVQFGDEWVSWPATGTGPPPFTVISWNMQFGAVTTPEAIDLLRRQDVDLIALQEVTNDTAEAIEADARLTARFPHRVLDPDVSVRGIGLLSRYPIVTHQFFADPAGVTARVDLGDDRQLAVLNAHPLPGRIGLFSFDGTRRDEALGNVRVRIDALLEDARPLIVIGDFNVASSEPAYRMLAAGLRDVHREVGLGPGWTWRPGSLVEMGVGVLRIDYVLAGPTVIPRSIGLDCRLPGDHCLVRAAVDIP